MKTCSRCGKEKPAKDFHHDSANDDGLTVWCAECNRTTNRSYYDRNRDKMIERSRRYYQEHREVHRARCARYSRRVGYATGVKPRTHKMVRAAIKRGDLMRQPCEICGSQPTEAHHDDYSKPLDVRWLCHQHHMEHHGKLRRERNRRRQSA